MSLSLSSLSVHCRSRKSQFELRKTAFKKEDKNQTHTWCVVTVCTHSVQHADNVFCVCERANLFVALAINYREGLQTQALHRNFGRQQKAMVELIEELVSEMRRKSCQLSTGLERTHTEYTKLVNFPYDLLMALDSSFSSSSSSRRR